MSWKVTEKTFCNTRIYTTKPSYPRIHTSCSNHATHIHQLDLYRVRALSTSGKSNPNRFGVKNSTITAPLVFTHFEKLNYLKTSCPELSWSNHPSYYFNYKRKAVKKNFLNVTCSLTVQNSFFKLKLLRHEYFLRNFEIRVGLRHNLNCSHSFSKRYIVGPISSKFESGVAKNSLENNNLYF